ncbi:MAG: PEP-CTERM sorting domain-containing protein [Planctomycetota bacterium]
MKKVLGFVGAAAIATGASAQVSNLDVTQVTDGSSVANIFAIDFAGLYQGTQLVVELTSGSIINETAFGQPLDAAPPEGQANFIPELLFDTYAAQGGRFAEGNIGGAPNLGGAAVNILPDDTEIRWDDPTRLSRAWNPAGGADVMDQTGFVVAQLGLSSDANGSLIFFASAADSFYETGEGGVLAYEIVDGVAQEVPEPATAALLGLGALAMLRRRGA